MKSRKKPGPKAGAGRADTPKLPVGLPTNSEDLESLFDAISRQFNYDMLGIDSPVTEMVMEAIDSNSARFSREAVKAINTFDAEFYFTVGTILKRFRELHDGYRSPSIIGGMRLLAVRLFVKNGQPAEFSAILAAAERCKWFRRSEGYSDKRLREECRKGGVLMAKSRPGPKGR